MQFVVFNYCVPPALSLISASDNAIPCRMGESCYLVHDTDCLTVCEWTLHDTVLLWKAKRQYLLTCKVSRYCPLALHGRKHLFLYQIMSLPVPWDRNTIIQIIQRNVTGLHRKCLFICWRNQPPLMPHCHQRTQHIHADCIKDNTAQPAVLKYLCINHGEQRGFSIWNHHKWFS